VEQPTADAGAPTRPGRGLLGRRAVVDDPDLVERRRADDELVELRVIRDGVDVEDVADRLLRRLRHPGRVAVDVDQPGVLGRIAVAVEARIDVLYDVIPRMPLLDDPRAARRLRLELDEHVAPDAVRRNE